MDHVNAYFDHTGEIPFVGDWVIMRDKTIGEVYCVVKYPWTKSKLPLISLKPGGNIHELSDIMGLIDDPLTKKSYIPYPFKPALIAANKLEIQENAKARKILEKVEEAEKHVAIQKGLWSSRLSRKK